MISTEETWNRFGERLLYYILSRVKERGLAEDIRQEVFVRIHEKLPTLRDGTRLKSWVFTITRNAINDYFSQQKNTSEQLEKYLHETSIVNEEVAVGYCLEPMLKKLPPEYEQALRLSDLEGTSQKELAQKLGISYSGLKSRVQRGRKLLKEAFRECCAYSERADGTLVAGSRDGCPKCGEHTDASCGA